MAHAGSRESRPLASRSASASRRARAGRRSAARAHRPGWRRSMLLDDQAEQEVVRVGVAHSPRPGGYHGACSGRHDLGRASTHARGAVSIPALRRIVEDVGQPAGVVEQLADGDRPASPRSGPEGGRGPNRRGPAALLASWRIVAATNVFVTLPMTSESVPFDGRRAVALRGRLLPAHSTSPSRTAAKVTPYAPP